MRLVLGKDGYDGLMRLAILIATGSVIVALGTVVFELWATRTSQLHPGNAVAASDSVVMKAFSLAILIVALLAAIETAHIFKPGLTWAAKAEGEEAPEAQRT